MDFFDYTYGYCQPIVLHHYTSKSWICGEALNDYGAFRDEFDDCRVTRDQVFWVFLDHFASVLVDLSYDMLEPTRSFSYIAIDYRCVSIFDLFLMIHDYYLRNESYCSLTWVILTVANNLAYFHVPFRESNLKSNNLTSGYIFMLKFSFILNFIMNCHNFSDPFWIILLSFNFLYFAETKDEISILWL